MPALGKVPFDVDAKVPTRTTSAEERVRRLEEAKTFLREQLAAGSLPAQMLLKAANTVGIATRTLHRAKDGLGVRTERIGGYGRRGYWMWHPPIGDQGPSKAAREVSQVAS